MQLTLISKCFDVKIAEISFFYKYLVEVAETTHPIGRKRGEDYDDYRKRCMVEAFKQAGERRGRRR